MMLLVADAHGRELRVDLREESQQHFHGMEDVPGGLSVVTMILKNKNPQPAYA